MAKTQKFEVSIGSKTFKIGDICTADFVNKNAYRLVRHKNSKPNEGVLLFHPYSFKDNGKVNSYILLTT